MIKATEFVNCWKVFTDWNAIFVNDGLIATNNENILDSIAEHLGKEFEVKMFNAECFLGLEIQRNSSGAIHLSQSGYAHRVLQKFNMIDCKPVSVSSNQSNFHIDKQLTV